MDFTDEKLLEVLEKLSDEDAVNLVAGLCKIEADGKKVIESPFFVKFAKRYAHVPI